MLWKHDVSQGAVMIIIILILLLKFALNYVWKTYSILMVGLLLLHYDNKRENRVEKSYCHIIVNIAKLWKKWQSFSKILWCRCMYVKDFAFFILLQYFILQQFYFQKANGGLLSLIKSSFPTLCQNTVKRSIINLKAFMATYNGPMYVYDRFSALWCCWVGCLRKWLHPTL